jgi:hypothetical protein
VGAQKINYAVVEFLLRFALSGNYISRQESVLAKHTLWQNMSRGDKDRILRIFAPVLVPGLQWSDCSNSILLLFEKMVLKSRASQGLSTDVLHSWWKSPPPFEGLETNTGSSARIYCYRRVCTRDKPVQIFAYPVSGEFFSYCCLTHLYLPGVSHSINHSISHTHQSHTHQRTLRASGAAETCSLGRARPATWRCAGIKGLAAAAL